MKNKDWTGFTTIFLLLFVALLLSPMFVQYKISNTSPQIETKLLKSAKLTKFSNAYFDENGNFVGMASNRHKVQYRPTSSFSIPRSGNVAVYPIPHSGGYFGDDDFVIAKDKLSKTISQNVKLDEKVRPLKLLRNVLFTIDIVILAGIFGVAVFVKDKNKNDNNIK